MTFVGHKTEAIYRRYAITEAKALEIGGDRLGARQHAGPTPEKVCRYVRAHEAELAPLSRREALKNITGGAR